MHICPYIKKTKYPNFDSVYYPSTNHEFTKYRIGLRDNLVSNQPALGDFVSVYTHSAMNSLSTELDLEIFQSQTNLHLECFMSVLLTTSQNQQQNGSK